MQNKITLKEQQRIVRSVSQGDYLINIATVLKCASEQSPTIDNSQLLETVSRELEFVSQHFKLI